jgi:colanic acid/amylovoran biosynthesis glycosyltransferase
MKLPLRVGYLLSEFPKLSETFVADEIREHVERNLDLTVISLRRPRPEQMRKLHALPRVSIENVFSQRRWLYLVEQLWLVTAALFTLPPLWRVLLGRGYGNVQERISILALAYRLRQIELRRPIDVLHCHFGRQGRYAAILRSIGLLRARIVTTFHGFDISSTLTTRGRDHYDILFKFGDLFLPISEYWARVLRELGCDPDRIVVHHMGVDCSRKALDARNRQNNEALRLISIGRMVEKKGHQFTLQALAELRKRRPGLQISFDLVGDGPLLQDLSVEASELGLNDVVTFHGARSHRATLALLRRASVFVLPSVTSGDGDMEGIPVSLMEAMADGMPVISTYHSGIPELIDNGVSGLLVPERDASALAGALEYMIDNTPAWPQFSRAGRRKVEAEFNRHTLSSRLQELYRGLIPQAAE